MGVSADAPYLDSAYKLTEFGAKPVMKLSAGKVTMPGAKQIFRGSAADVLALRNTERGQATWIRASIAHTRHDQCRAGRAAAAAGQRTAATRGVVTRQVLTGLARRAAECCGRAIRP